MPKIHLPPSEALYPVPVVLVSCGDKDKANIITIAWCGVVCSKPPLLSISVRPGRHSHELISRTGDFAINIPGERLLEKADICGTLSGASVDKVKKCGFVMSPSSKIGAPIIEDCPVNIECRLVKSIPLGAHDMFIGEVVAVHADPNVLAPEGGIDFKKAAPIVYNCGEYWNLGEKIGRYGFSCKK